MDAFNPLPIIGTPRHGDAPQSKEIARQTSGAPLLSTASGVLYVPAAVRPFSFPSPTHFDDAIQKAYAHAERIDGVQRNTVLRWRTAIGQLSAYLEAERQLDTLLRGDLEEQMRVLIGWIGWLRDRDVSRVSIRTYWSSVAAVFHRIATLHSSVNPFRYMARPKATPRQPRYLTRSQAETVLRTMRNYAWRSRLEGTCNLAVVGCMLLAGLRRAEVLHLDYSDVKLDLDALLIRRAKGRHGGRDRTAYMSRQLRTFLLEYLDERTRARWTGPELFITQDATAPLTVDVLRRVFRTLSRSVGFCVTPHMLRHTYATLLRTEDVSDRIAADLMGHRSIAMLRHYSHVYDGEAARAAAKLHLDL